MAEQQVRPFDLHSEGDDPEEEIEAAGLYLSTCSPDTWGGGGGMGWGVLPGKERRRVTRLIPWWTDTRLTGFPGK